MAWRQRQMLEAGARAPEFELRDLGGGHRASGELLARGPVLLAFFKISCPVCQFTFPFLERLHQGAGGPEAAVHIIGVSQDNAGKTREFASEYGLSFPLLLDPAGGGYAVSNAFAIQTVPSLFLIERDGTIASAGYGFSKKDLEALGHRLGVAPFRAGENIPEFRPG